MKPINFSIVLSYWLCFCTILSIEAFGSIRKDEGIFFPEQFRDTLKTYKAFPIFWWNFLIFEWEQEGDWEKIESICSQLKRTENVRRVECLSQPQDYLKLALDWAGDVTHRQFRVSDSRMEEKFRSALAKASLPLPQGMVTLLRSDPLESYKDLRKIAEDRLPLKLPRQRGFFFDDNKVLIPLQPAFAPSDVDATEKLMAVWKGPCRQSGDCERWTLIGPHASAYENRKQIESDLMRVSLVGPAVLLILITFILMVKRASLLWLVPPVFVGVALSALTLILTKGGLHGLTLSFGVGIIGLSLDYGFHVAFLSREKKIWLSNGIGLITTWAVLVVLAFSEIPLLRELVIFSILGLFYAFMALYLMHRYRPVWLSVTPFKIDIGGSLPKGSVVAVVILGVLVGLVAVRPNLDMRQFDFKTQKTKEMASWLAQKMDRKPPLFAIHTQENRGEILDRAHQELSWANDRAIAVENVAVYLPRLTKQQDHLLSWSERECSTQAIAQGLSPLESKFFSPFLESIQCNRLKIRYLNTQPIPEYLNHLHVDSQWLTLWFPESELHEGEIREVYPDVISLYDLVSIFPQSLSRELKWMAPTALFLVVGLLFAYYRRLGDVFLALLPFLSGTGLVCWAVSVFGMPFSFISGIALIMVCGLSVDYGIFVTDHVRGQRHAGGVESALLLAAASTIAGFFPLIFCSHQVLSHLGLTLTVGTLGTLLGAFWGIPSLARWRSETT